MKHEHSYSYILVDSLHKTDCYMMYIFIGLHYSVMVEDVMAHFMYQAEMCLQLCAETTVQVLYFCVHS